MKTVEEQLAVIKSLIGDDCDIKVKEDGFLSRGFVIDNGRLVFKFPRNKDVRYKTEIENLNYINSLNLGINLQKVAFTSANDEYLGIYGVLGSSLEEVGLNNKQLNAVGTQLGNFLKRLHAITGHNGQPCVLKDEVESWQKRVVAVDDFLVKTFSKKEQSLIKKLMFDYMPNRLKELGEKLVFSHGDLGDGNILVDGHSKVGVIDFNDSGLLDEAADFMDIKSNRICEVMLDTYGADDVLREKVALRRDIRPLIVLKPYLTRNDPKVIGEIVAKIRNTLAKYESIM